MRVLILHARYASGVASGENRVVDDEVQVLRAAGHQVRIWDPPPDVDGPVALARAAARAVWSRAAAAAATDLIRVTRPDVVHCHNLFPSLSPTVLRAAHDAGVPTLVTLHNYRLLCLPGTFVRDGRVCEDCLGRSPWRGAWHGCYRGSVGASSALAASVSLHRRLATFDTVTRYLAVSRFVRDRHVLAGMPADRIGVKPNFAWPQPVRRGPGRRFLFLGRLAEEKGVATLLAAWRPSLGTLTVAGDGPLAASLRAAAPAGVEFLGTVPPHDIPTLLRDARALLVPSICFEGQPRTILEAYAAGVPVIASRLGALPELVGDGTTGRLVPPGDAAAWTHVIEAFDERQAQRLGEGAYARWRAQFTPAAGLRALEDAYRDAIRAYADATAAPDRALR